MDERKEKGRKEDKYREGKLKRSEKALLLLSFHMKWFTLIISFTMCDRNH
jgi:hypothetical protein